MRVPAGAQVRVTNLATGISILVPIVDKGPFNIRDQYAVTGARPQAEAQHAAPPGTHQGTDQMGHHPVQNAGIDLTPATMNALGVPGGQNNRQWHMNIQYIPPPNAPPQRPPAHPAPPPPHHQ
jgi:hypothetical protein